MLTGLNQTGVMPPAPLGKPSVVLAVQEVKPSVKELTFTLQLPAGLQLNPQAPSELELSSSDGSVAKIAASSISVTATTLTVPLQLTPGQTTLSLNLTVFYCSHGQQALCYFKQAALSLPLKISDQGSDVLELTYPIH